MVVNSSQVVYIYCEVFLISLLPNYVHFYAIILQYFAYNVTSNGKYNL